MTPSARGTNWDGDSNSAIGASRQRAWSSFISINPQAPRRSPVVASTTTIGVDVLLRHASGAPAIHAAAWCHSWGPGSAVKRLTSGS